MSSPADRIHLLIAYDGSSGAQTAIEHAAKLWPGATADVLTVWRSTSEAAGAARLALSAGMVVAAVKQLDKAAQGDAEGLAAVGVELARELGLDAAVCTTKASASAWAAIVETAREHHADAIVLGTRGRSAARATLLGGVSEGVVHHADRPVMVVPPSNRTVQDGPDPISALLSVDA